MAVFETTQRQYFNLTGKWPGRFSNETCRASRPVDSLVMVTYNNSFLAELNIKPESLEGWSGTISFASDHGKEPGNNTGVMLTIRKSGLIKK